MSAADGPVTIRTVRDLDGIAELRETWGALQRHPWTDIDYYLARVAREAGFLRPHVMVLERAGAPIGLVVASLVRERIAFRIGSLTLWRSRARVLRVGGGGLLGEDSEATARAIEAELLAALARGEADVAYLHQVDVDSPLPARLRALPWPARDGWARASAGWLLELPATYEAFFASRTKSVRRHIKRYAGALERKLGDDVRIACYREPDDLERLVTDCEAVARLTYHRGMGVGFRDTPELRATLRHALAAGWMRGYVMYVRERPIAFWHGLVYAGTLFTRDTGYDPEFAELRPGQYVLNAVIEGFCRTREVERLDYGIMELDYKRNFGTRRYERVSPYVFSRRPRGLWLATLRSLAGIADRTARKLLGDRARTWARRWARFGRREVAQPTKDGDAEA